MAALAKNYVFTNKDPLITIHKPMCIVHSIKPTQIFHTNTFFNIRQQNDKYMETKSISLTSYLAYTIPRQILWRKPLC